MTPSSVAATLALLAPAVSSSGETPAAYSARLDTIAQAVASVARSPEDVAAVLVIWWAESRFDERIHAGRKHPIWTQDAGRARCMGQLHQSVRVPEWATLAGTDLEATTRCAAATLRALNSAAWLCSRGTRSSFDAVSMSGVFAAYANGHSCTPSRQSERRASEWIKARSVARSRE